ncbi:MAG: hypothetical protein L3K18_09155 [Thermoplasmata archaeon]|nr:hypothetical protein [Thermoplasmata archaeon]
MRRPRRRLGRGAVLLAVVLALVLPAFATAAPAPPTGPTNPLAPKVPVGAAPAGAPLRPGSALPAATFPVLQWGTAFILYGPGDDAGHFMGQGAAMVVDDHLRNMTTFGGEGSEGLTNWTVNYNSTTGYFIVNVTNPTPSARENASFADVPGRDFAVLFGGLTNLTTDASVNDTWVYYFANQTWRNVTHGAAPPAREAAAFAANGTGNVALLEGGANPDYKVNGSTAAVFWNDTWSLNLTTFNWTERHPTTAPPPLFGSGMIWQNATDRYELFGGCALGCSSTLWTYGGQPANWSPIRHAFGAPVPSARGASAFAWDGPNNIAVLFGGFDWGSGGAPTALGDGWLYSPRANAWTQLGASGGPFPVYDAPNVWANYPGCEGLNIVGGSISLAAPPGTVSVLEPIGANSTNCFPNLFLGGGSPPPLPCQGNHSSLQLQVVDNQTGAAIPNASVDIAGGCIQQEYHTDAHGFLNLTLPAPDSDNLTGLASGYRAHKIVHQFFPNGSYNLTLPLDPEPTLHVRTWNATAEGALVPLPGVSVEQGNFISLGTTGPSGWLNVSHLNALTGNLTIYGVLPHHSRAQAIVSIPQTGVVLANLTLDDAGPFRLHVVDSITGNGLPGAQGALTNLDPGAPRPTTFTTGPGGWFNLTVLDSANYSLKTNDSGYYSNETWFHQLWAQTEGIVVPLVEKIGANLDALVRNSQTGAPVAAATVTILGFGSILTVAGGWANFTGIKPAGPFEVEASAAGFITNYTWTTLDYSEVVNPYAIVLVPITTCLGTSACPGQLATNAPPFGYLNGGGGVAILLVAFPVALLAAGVAYAWLAARRNPTPAPRVRAPRGGGAP